MKRYDVYKRAEEGAAQRWVTTVWAPSRKAALDKVAQQHGVPRIDFRARYVATEGRAEA